MGALELGFGIVLLVFAVGIIALVLLPTHFYLKIKAVPLMHFYLDGQQ